MLENKKISPGHLFETYLDLYEQTSRKKELRHQKPFSQKEMNTKAVNDVVDKMFLIHNVERNPELEKLVRKAVIKEIRKSVPGTKFK